MQKKGIVPTKKELQSFIGVCKAFNNICLCFKGFSELPFPEVDLLTEEEAKYILNEILDILKKYKEDYT